MKILFLGGVDQVRLEGDFGDTHKHGGIEPSS